MPCTSGSNKAFFCLLLAGPSEVFAAGPKPIGDFTAPRPKMVPRYLLSFPISGLLLTGSWTQRDSVQEGQCSHSCTALHHSSLALAEHLPGRTPPCAGHGRKAPVRCWFMETLPCRSHGRLTSSSYRAPASLGPGTFQQVVRAKAGGCVSRSGDHLPWAGLLQEYGAAPCPPEWAPWGTHSRRGGGSPAGVVIILPASVSPSNLRCTPHAVPRSCSPVPAWRGLLD